MGSRSTVRWIILTATCLTNTLGGISGAEERLQQQPFPRTLTLGQALAMLDENDPALRQVDATMAMNRAAKARLDGRNALTVSFDLELRGSDRIAQPGHDFTNDSRMFLTLDKPLSRFGLDSAMYDALETGAKAISVHWDQTQAKIRHKVVRAFFAVILADYAYAAQDEVMTLAFLAYDRQRERMERFNEASLVEVHQLEATYLDAFAERTRLGLERRASRLHLALALNRADAYPDRMVEPDLSGYQRETPDYDEALAKVLENSPALQVIRLETQAAHQHRAGLSIGVKPVLGTRFEGGEYHFRTPSTRDQFRASIYLKIPVVSDLQRRGEMETTSARVLELEAKKMALENELREEVLRLVQRLAYLDTEIRAAEAELLYSELELDRVRSLYEMEVRTRIGSANAMVATAVHRVARARYLRALVWDELDILMNNEPVQFQ